jgi:hypothetical protein
VQLSSTRSAAGFTMYNSDMKKFTGLLEVIDEARQRGFYVFFCYPVN